MKERKKKTKMPYGGIKPMRTTFGFLLYMGLVTLLAVFILWTLFNSNPNSLSTTFASASVDSQTNCSCSEGAHYQDDANDGDSFYDDPKLSYTIENPIIRNWDQKRSHWLKHHGRFGGGDGNQILVVTGSQSSTCRNPTGDHLLLRFFKNKVDYCRIHGYDIFYNNVLFHPKMKTFWAKIPLLRAAMIAHPQAEWIWWIDSDAAFTDMDFKLPLHRYKNHNLIVHGWPDLIYKKQSWVGLNAGVFLIRNCQWSMDFMDVWASMGPITPTYDHWGEILKSTFKEKIFPDSDDQSALVYLLLKEKEKWADKIYLEHEYYFEGYWVEIVETLDIITNKYLEMERRVPHLRRRHAEKASEYYGSLRDKHLKKNEVGYGRGSWRRPFITHFTGCQPCGGVHSNEYSWETCFSGMTKVLNFADNQVLRNFGFVHPDLLDSSSVSPLPFDFPL